jgi:hypothetical protein
MKKMILPILLFCIVNAHGQISNGLTPTEKVYGLSKFWQEVNYNFVYLNKVNKENGTAHISLLFLRCKKQRMTMNIIDYLNNSVPRLKTVILTLIFQAEFNLS